MSSQNQITAMLMLKVPGKDNWQGMGRKAFSVLPRTGELIEYDVDGIGERISIPLYLEVLKSAPKVERNVGDQLDVFHQSEEVAS